VEAAISLNLPADFPSPKIKSEIICKKNEVRDEINFLLCGACFWCASNFNNYRDVVTKCPTCGTENVESMPISHDEVYTFSHSRSRGITLEFSKIRDVLK
jgi:hypothetical protein